MYSSDHKARFKQLVESTPAQALAFLAGEVEPSAHNNAGRNVQQLVSSTPERHSQRAMHVERCAVRFAKACQRYEEAHGLSPKSEGFNPRFLSFEYLDTMGQAMPFGVLMPIYFHNARWPYQFARQEAGLSHPLSDGTQTSLAQLRNQQAAVLQRVRQAGRREQPMNAHEQMMFACDQAKIRQNDQLLRPYEAMRQAMRRETLAAVKAFRSGAQVIEMKAAAKPKDKAGLRVA